MVPLGSSFNAQQQALWSCVRCRRVRVVSPHAHPVAYLCWADGAAAQAGIKTEDVVIAVRRFSMSVSSVPPVSFSTCSLFSSPLLYSVFATVLCLPRVLLGLDFAAIFTLLSSVFVIHASLFVCELMMPGQLHSQVHVLFSLSNTHNSSCAQVNGVDVLDMKENPLHYVVAQMQAALSANTPVSLTRVRFNRENIRRTSTSSSPTPPTSPTNPNISSPPAAAAKKPPPPPPKRSSSLVPASQADEIAAAAAVPRRLELERKLQSLQVDLSGREAELERLEQDEQLLINQIQLQSLQVPEEPHFDSDRRAHTFSRPFC